MRLRHILLLFLLGLSPGLLLGQIEKLKFGKIDEADLKLEACTFDPEAEAMVLGEKCKLHFIYNENFGFKYVHEYHVRIKIFNSTGYEYGNGQVHLYGSHVGTKETIGRIRGFTYNLVGGQVKREKLSKDDIFVEKANDKHTVYRFTMPKVQDGSIVEYTYLVQSGFLNNLQPWVYQREIPVRFSEAEFLIPEFFHYKNIVTGSHPLELSKQERRQETFADFSSLSHHYHWGAVKVPAIRQEPFMTAVKDYASQIRFQLATLKFPHQPVEQYMSDYHAFTQTLLESENFGKVIADGKGFPDEVISKLKAITAPTQRAVAAFETVKRHMRWNEKQAFTAEGQTRKLWREAEGDVGDINLLLTALYRAVDLEAYPVILSTRSHGKPHPVFPSVDHFNYVVSAVKVEGNWSLTDASLNVLPFGLLPPKALNGQGWALGPQPRWINLQDGALANQSVAAHLKMNEAGELTGKIKIEEVGYPAFYTRAMLHDEASQVKFIADLKAETGQWTVDSMTWEHQEDLYEALKGEINLVCTDAFKGDRFYLQPVLYGLPRENPFKRESRNFPVDMAFGKKQEYSLNLSLPSGYTYEEIPKAEIIRMPNHDAEFIFQVQRMGNMLSILGTLKINKTYYLPEEYSSLRQFYTIVIQRLSQPIVIKKKT